MVFVVGVAVAGLKEKEEVEREERELGEREVKNGIPRCILGQTPWGEKQREFKRYERRDQSL